METTELYIFLHFLSLIKTKPNMDFGGIWHLHIYAKIHFFLSFFLLKDSGEKLTSNDQTKR